MTKEYRITIHESGSSNYRQSFVSALTESDNADIKDFTEREFRGGETIIVIDMLISLSSNIAIGLFTNALYDGIKSGSIKLYINKKVVQLKDLMSSEEE